MNKAVIIFLLSALCATHCGAVELEVMEIIDLTIKKQVDDLSDRDWFKHAHRFDELMKSLGEKFSLRSKAEISQLNPEALEDRVQLIALHRLQHHDLYEVIYNTYVKYPTKEEAQKRFQKARAMEYATPDALRKEAENSSRNLQTVHGGIDAPLFIEKVHLASDYSFCFEYLWMVPIHDRVMRGYMVTLESAMDHFKKASGAKDIRDLVRPKVEAFKSK